MLCCAVRSCLVMSSLCKPMDCSLPVSSIHRDSPGRNTGVGCHALLQGIFPTQGSNLGLPHWGVLSHQGSPRILGWLAYPFSSYSSQPRIELGSPALQVDSLPAELPGNPPLYVMPPKVTSGLRTHLIMQETWETWVRSLTQEDPLEEGMAIHYSILAWRIPWTEEAGGL